MITLNPLLPDPKDPNFTVKLKDILREIAIEVNRTTNSQWDGNHPVLGSYHLWVDSTGDLRIKSSQPTSDTDGNIVGTQS